MAYDILCHLRKLSKSLTESKHSYDAKTVEHAIREIERLRAQNVGGDVGQDLRAEMTKALDSHTRWSRDCHLTGEFLCGKVWPLVEAALAAQAAQKCGLERGAQSESPKIHQPSQ